MKELYIVNGWIDNYGDEDDWVEEIFDDKEQAEACCKYLNMIKSQKNVEYTVYKIDGLCNEDYVSKLNEIKEFEWLYNQE